MDDSYRLASSGFDTLAASIRADARDLRTFLDVLADKLSRDLPGHVTVKREGGLFARERRVRLISITLDEQTYELEWQGGEVEGRLPEAQPYGQPLLRPAPLDRWIEALARHLSEYARTAAQARTAMDSLISGQLPAETVSRPAAAAGQIVYARPPARISLASRVQLAPDERLVLRLPEGTVGPAGPGLVELVSLPIGDQTVDPQLAEIEAAIYIVATREITGFKFGGAIDKVLDPETGLAIGLRVFGDYSLQVVDAAALVSSLGGGDLTNDHLGEVMRDLILKVLRTDVVSHIGRQGWPILGLAAHSGDIEAETLARVHQLSSGYGLQVSRFGNFTISMKEEDEELLTRHRARLAEQGAGSGQAACPQCGTAIAVSARFCPSCGVALTLACPGCGATSQPGARFCQSCGSALRPAEVHNA